MVAEVVQVHHARRREHQESRQRRARDEARIGREHQHDERDGGRRDDARPLRLRARLLVDRRSRQRARARHALEEAAGEVREALAQALLVHVELLPGHGGDGLRHRDRLEQAEQRDRERAAGEVAQIAARASAGRRGGRQRGRDVCRPPRRLAPPSPNCAVDRGHQHDDDQELRQQPPAEHAASASAARGSARSTPARWRASGRGSAPPCVIGEPEAIQEMVVRRRRPPSARAGSSSGRAPAARSRRR